MIEGCVVVPVGKYAQRNVKLERMIGLETYRHPV